MMRNKHDKCQEMQTTRGPWRFNKGLIFKLIWVYYIYYKLMSCLLGRRISFLMVIVKVVDTSCT